MGSYLDSAGLTQVWGKLKDKIDAAKEVKSLTKAEYDALETKEQNVIYSVTDGEGDNVTTSIWLNGEQLNEKYKNIKVLPLADYYFNDLISASSSGTFLFSNPECTKYISYNDFDRDTLYFGSCRIYSKNNNIMYKTNDIVRFIFYISSNASHNANTIITNYNVNLQQSEYGNHEQFQLSFYNSRLCVSIKDAVRGSNASINHFAPIINEQNIFVNNYSFDNNEVILNGALKDYIYHIGTFRSHYTITYQCRYPITLYIKYDRGSTGLAELIINISLSSNAHHNEVVFTQVSGRIIDGCPLGDFIFSDSSLYVKLKSNTPALSTGDNLADRLRVGCIGNKFVTSAPYRNYNSIKPDAVYFTPITGFKQQIGNKIIFTTEKDYTDAVHTSEAMFNHVDKINNTFYEFTDYRNRIGDMEDTATMYGSERIVKFTLDDKPEFEVDDIMMIPGLSGYTDSNVYGNRLIKITEVGKDYVKGYGLNTDPSEIEDNRLPIVPKGNEEVDYYKAPETNITTTFTTGTLTTLESSLYGYYSYWDSWKPYSGDMNAYMASFADASKFKEGDILIIPSIAGSYHYSHAGNLLLEVLKVNSNNTLHFRIINPDFSEENGTYPILTIPAETEVKLYIRY